MYFDLSMRNSFLPQCIVNSAIVPGVAANTGEQREGERGKDDKYDSNVSATSGLFDPIVVESLGHWTPSSLHVLKTIAIRSVLDHISLGDCVEL